MPKKILCLILGSGLRVAVHADGQEEQPRYQLYGYDRSAMLDDAATLNDTTHDDLPTPTTTTRPTLNVNADWRA